MSRPETPTVDADEDDLALPDVSDERIVTVPAVIDELTSFSTGAQVRQDS